MITWYGSKSTGPRSYKTIVLLYNWITICVWIRLVLLWVSASPSVKWGCWPKIIFVMLSMCKKLWFLKIMYILKIIVWNQTSKLVLNISDPRCHGRKSGICGWSCYTPDTLDTNILEPDNKMGASILENNKVGTMWVLSGLHFQHYLAHKDDVCCFQEAAPVQRWSSQPTGKKEENIRGVRIGQHHPSSGQDHELLYSVRVLAKGIKRDQFL